MADQTKINVTGIDEVCRLLDSAPERIVKGTFAKALSAAAVPLVEAVKAKIPIKTGDLAEALKTDVLINSQGKGGTARVGFGEGKQGATGRWLELGHAEIGHSPDYKELGPDVQPHPFLRPALAESAAASTEAFKASVLKSLEDTDL